MKKKDRKRALKFMKAYLGLCRAHRCSVEKYIEPRDGSGRANGVEIFVWDPTDDRLADTFSASNRKLLTRRIDESL